MKKILYTCEISNEIGKGMFNVNIGKYLKSNYNVTRNWLANENSWNITKTVKYWTGRKFHFTGSERKNIILYDKHKKVHFYGSVAQITL